MEEIQTPENQQPRKRPELLTILCILTFIGSGLGTFSNLVLSLSYEMMQQMASSGELSFPGMDVYFAVPRSYYVGSFFFMLGSLLGAIQMWKLRRIGFHIYTVSQILLLVLPSLYAQNFPYPYLNVLITAVFILLYAMNLKHMS
ncbi:MAG: hypothetical protein K9G58_04250 [Bacteroidales bacterium]|nr:hypothetical protein [Bacteroidales bacterium]MCF8387007.1 hypothetical protein [Bacteroidales bacterium]MCF8397356.1 hypothetical protein [Bacteroidales bacterium]